jgi:steroid delta-isomerase
MEVSDKVAMVHKYVEAFANSDMKLIREIYADDAVVEDPVGTEPHVGIDAVCGFYETALGMGITLALTGTPRCAGNAVAFPFEVNAGATRIEIIDVFEFNDAGKVCHMRAYWGPDNSVNNPG